MKRFQVISERGHNLRKFDITNLTQWRWIRQQNPLNQKISFSILASLLVVYAVSMVVLTIGYLMKKKDIRYRRTHFRVLFDLNIRSVFKNQSPEALNTMLLGVRAALSSHCERPPVLLFLATGCSYNTALTISKRLVQAYLTARGSVLCTEKLKKIVMKGRKYQGFDDQNIFKQALMKRLASFQVAIVSDFQCLHPQVASVLCALADGTFSPYPKALIILLANVDNFFTGTELLHNDVMKMAESYTSHIMNGFLSGMMLSDLQRTICGRPSLIQPELEEKNKKQ